MTTGSVLKYLLEGCLNIRVLCYSLYEDQVYLHNLVADTFFLSNFFSSLPQEHLVTDAYVEQLLQINPMPALVAFYFEKCVLTEEVAWFCFINGHTQKIEHILQNMDFC